MFGHFWKPLIDIVTYEVWVFSFTMADSSKHVLNNTTGYFLLIEYVSVMVVNGWKITLNSNRKITVFYILRQSSSIEISWKS